MLKPMQQGKVGSCFATAPTRRLRQSEPMKAMQELTNIATTGSYKPANGPEVPIVTNCPDGDDPLLRSWEFSLATSSARVENSKESDELVDGTVGQIYSLKNRLQIILGIDEQEKDKRVAAFCQKLKTDITFDYDPADKAPGGANDGSSTMGRFVLKSVEFGPAAQESRRVPVGDRADRPEYPRTA